MVTGPSGVGKSWLACALGQKACRDDFSVLYKRVPRLFAELEKYPEVTSPVFDLNDEDPSGIEGPTPTADASASDFTPSRVRSISVSFNPSAAFATRSAEPAVVEAAGKTEDDANPADRPAAEFITASGTIPPHHGEAEFRTGTTSNLDGSRGHSYRARTAGYRDEAVSADSGNTDYSAVRGVCRFH